LNGRAVSRIRLSGNACHHSLRDLKPIHQFLNAEMLVAQRCEPSSPFSIFLALMDAK
jgi:hypothetical protein